ncbi:extrinsic protein in photosystem ii [Nannochloropsis gaditana]|uniref:Extrinsic protein in photosystem ii n=2 Tax=Nannochloropsis gaditana TaxID=72520 RepID=W7TJZ9_9STRA|nr:extrinsic protein in photosystem ii [Nannochloropsis gaditana]
MRMTAEKTSSPLSLGNVVKGFATASMFFNFATMPLTSMPESALAKSGEGPKQSVFGLGGDAASSPFVQDVPTYSPYSPYGTGENALFKPLNADDVKLYTSKVTESKKRVDKIAKYLEKKQWEEVRTELTRQMYDLRRSGQKLAENKQSPEASKALKSLFQDIEDLTVASRRKQVDVSQAAYSRAQADFDAFLKAL